MSCNAKAKSRESSLDAPTSTAPWFRKRPPTHTRSRTSCGRFSEGQSTTFCCLWSEASSSTRKNLRSYRRSCKPLRVRRRNLNELTSRDLIRSSAQFSSPNRYLCHCGGGLLACRCEGESKASIFLLSHSAPLLSGSSGYQHPLAFIPNNSCRGISTAGSLGRRKEYSTFLDLAGSF